MNRIEQSILFRCHILGKAMTNPQGKTNAQKYAEAAEAEQKKLEAMEAAMAKKEANEKLIDDLEPGKDNYVSARKNTKSPAEKYNEALGVRQVLNDKLDLANQKLEEARRKTSELWLMKDVPTLSKEFRNVLKTMAIEIRYGRRKRMDNKYLKKGRAVEDASIALYSELKGEFYENNKIRKSNKWFTGEWDVEELDGEAKVDAVKEFKSRYDIDSFEDNRDEDAQKKEEAQLMGYMDILDCNRGSLVNVLTNNDFGLIGDEIRREAFSYKPEELDGFDIPMVRLIEIAKDSLFDYDGFKGFLALHIGTYGVERLEAGAAEEGVQKMFDSFVEVPLEERVIEIEVERDDAFLDAVKVRIQEGRQWLAMKYNIHHVEE